MEESGNIDIEFRDAQPPDLDALAWSGGTAHTAALDAALTASWHGDVVLLVGELPNGRLIASGALDLRLDPPRIWMVAVHEAWQSLGVGAALIAALRERAAESGADHVSLSVETDNPRARTLYRRLGFVQTDSIVESWPLDDGRTYVTSSDLMVAPSR